MDTFVSDEETSSQLSLSTAAGVCQLSNSILAPGLKNNENFPPSGPSHRRSSPPKAFICGSGCLRSNVSYFIQPKLLPSKPSAVEVNILAWYLGDTATIPKPLLVFKITMLS